MTRMWRLSVLLALCGFMLLTPATPTLAGDEGFELKVAQPGPVPKAYTEAFPTEVEATARLWNQIKINAIDEQTQALRVEFDQFKAVRFQRQESTANQVGIQAIQYQPQPEHIPALAAAAIRW